MQFNKALMALLGSGLASSHMIMKTPTPYGAASINNSPLVADGSDYPCKQRPGVYDKGSASNTMAVGSQQTLSFTGSAVHGGGSCQLSLTKDLKPTKDTDFRVILSIEGGCPASAAGNLPEDQNGSGASTFTYSIPKDVAPGDYTLAWTWFNKIGNREMYMNCAPITVTGGSKKRDTNDTIAHDSEDHIFTKRDLTTLPKMFLANIQSVSGTCHTADSTDLAFPDPGAVVQKKGSGQLTPPTGDCKVASGNSSGAASGSAASPSTAPSGAAGEAQAGSPSASPSGLAASPSAGSSNGSVPTVGSLGTHTILATTVPTPSTIPSPSAAAPSASASANSTASGSTGSEGSSGATGSSGTTGTTGSSGTSSSGTTGTTGSSGTSGSGSTGSTTSQICSSGVVCSPDGTMFGLCDNGKALMQPVAAGTKCQGGTIVHAKRSARPIRRRGRNTVPW